MYFINYSIKMPKSGVIACLICLLLFCYLISNAQLQFSQRTTINQLETGFAKIPDHIQTTVYWYWISDNISKEGVVKDLEAMKKVGINRAFIGNIGFEGGMPYGKIKLFSPEWWDVLHTALKTATRLNITIGIFNSPGWSQSGGPWVKSAQSMRYLASTQINVSGPLKLARHLSTPGQDFQDVKVIAYPAPASETVNSRVEGIQVSASAQMGNLKNLIDGNDRTVVTLTNSIPLFLDFTLREAAAIKSLKFEINSPTLIEGDILVKINNTFEILKHFVIDRSNPNVSVGFRPYGAAAFSLPESRAREYRIILYKFSPETNISEITFSETPVVENYIEKSLAKMWQDPYPQWTAYQWFPTSRNCSSSGIIKPSAVKDISQYMNAKGLLEWQVPPGKWIIERTGMLSTSAKNGPASPEGSGLETDKMSKKHIAAHFEAFLGEIIRRIPAEDRKTWKVTVEDSYEVGSQNWTDDFIEKFKSAYSYDPVPFIPVLNGRVVGSADQSERFLWDLRRLVADLVAYEYVGGLREISHKYGLTTWLENYGHFGFPGEFLQYGGQSDEVSGEFWSEGDLGDIENRAAASTAHIYGKNKVSAESFTSGGPAYSRYPALMKRRADRFFTEGINNTLLHVYIQQPDDHPLPGKHTWFGNDFNRLNTWFYDMDIFIDYLKRCNMLLQQGNYIADVAYFIGEDAPKMTGVRNPALPLGYSFDYINAEVIKTRLDVKDGKLFLPDGMSYKILVLPKLETMRPELLLRIKELVLKGAVVLGPRPSRSPSLQNYNAADADVQKVAAELWADIDGRNVKEHHLGKGVVLDGMDMEEAFKYLNVIPDFKSGPLDSLLFIHRTLKDGEVYFVSNQKNTKVNVSPEFRCSDKIPELWDPLTGKMYPLPEYTQSATTTKVPLYLAPAGSAFIIFRKPGFRKASIGSNNPPVKRTLFLTDEWLVKFDPKMRGPSGPIIFKELVDWSQVSNDSIKYYSGTATYQKDFVITKLASGIKVYLDLGTVGVIAKVKLNGINVGGVWTAPYQLDITAAIKPGKNSLAIKVVNTWENRLIGDQRLPINQRKTKLYYNEWYFPNSPLKFSGLLGPVKIEIK
jgi:hypothetical protein